MTVFKKIKNVISDKITKNQYVHKTNLKKNSCAQ